MAVRSNMPSPFFNGSGFSRESGNGRLPSVPPMDSIWRLPTVTHACPPRFVDGPSALKKTKPGSDSTYTSSNVAEVEKLLPP